MTQQSAQNGPAEKEPVATRKLMTCFMIFSASIAYISVLIGVNGDGAVWQVAMCLGGLWMLASGIYLISLLWKA